MDGSQRGLLYDPLDLDRSMGSGSHYMRSSSGGPQFIELRPGGGRMRESDEIVVDPYSRPSLPHPQYFVRR
jgi:hypothetical protein